MRLIGRIVAVCALASLVALAGCRGLRSRDSCEEHQDYMRAVDGAPLRAAEGLPTANTKNALKVPEAKAEFKPRKASDACLDQAPSFYADRPKPKPPK
jgi:uncharacterized lipoprotein